MTKFFPQFTPIESTPQLAEGYYTATIVKAEQKLSKTGNLYIEVKVEIDGHLGAKPDTAKLFAPTITNDEKSKWMLEAKCKEFTRLFDNFGITRGNFGDDDKMNEWIGKKGTISIVPQSNQSGYNEIVLYELTKREFENRKKKADEPKEKKESSVINPIINAGYIPQSFEGFSNEIPM